MINIDVEHRDISQVQTFYQSADILSPRGANPFKKYII